MTYRDTKTGEYRYKGRWYSPEEYHDMLDERDWAESERCEDVTEEDENGV